ncbi:MAG: ketoacyl-ACP synthase III [Firmicutes bacterium]|nr:ketoacyl-ACP synthase III [Bacillota bacterium]
MIQVGISSIGMSVPEKVLTNSDLERMVDTTDEWITTRTGIKERRIMETGESMTGHVAQAAKRACAKADVDSSKLDFVISSTMSGDLICPAQAYEVARELGANRAFCFDLNAACTGLIYSLAAAESFLKTREITTGVVTAGEQLSKLTDYTDRNTCVLFGDAAAAMVLTNQNPEHLLLYTELGSEPDMSKEVIIGGVSDLTNNRLKDFYFRQNGKVVFKFAVNVIRDLLDLVPRKAGLKPEQIKYVVPHQANQRIIMAAQEMVSSETKIISNIEKYGNTSSASIGLALAENWNYFQKGDYILLIGFGGGLSWGAALLEW